MGWPVSLTPWVAEPADLPHRHRVVIDARQRAERAQWPHLAIAAAGADIAAHVHSDDVTIGVVASLRHDPTVKSTPVQWMTVLPTHLDYRRSLTPRAIADGVRTWLASASSAVLAGERPEQLLATTPSAWRVGRIHGPTINVVPYRGGQAWDTEVHAWGPVDDCLINVIEDRGRLLIDGLFHRALYTAADAQFHVCGVAAMIATSVERPDEPFVTHSELVATSCADRVAIAGGHVDLRDLRTLLSAIGLHGDAVQFDTSRGLTVRIRGGDAERARARSVLPPGIRIRTS